MTQAALTVELSIGDPDLAERVRAALGVHSGFAIVAVGAEQSPQVLITDAIEELSSELEETMVVVVLADPAATAEALRMGAVAVLPEDVGARALRAAVRAAALGLATVPAKLRHHLLDGREHHPTGNDEGLPAVSLSARELQVLQLLVEGASNKAIARRLGITPHTAKFHVGAITSKLGASGRTDAVAKALRLGLVMV